MDKCDWYQYDDVIVDPASNGAVGMGSFRRSYGSAVQCGIVGPSGEASLEVRAYMDDNKDSEYGPNTDEGVPFNGKRIKITDEKTGKEIDYAAEQCTGGPGNTLGGVGRKVCPKLDLGKFYAVDIVDTLPNTTGPIKEPHNSNATKSVDIKLVGDPAKDIVDFGFLPKAVTEGPTCTLAAQPNKGNAPLDVDFTATVSPANTTVSTYDWVFGDTQTAQTTGNTTQHTYKQQGSYTPAVNATTDKGVKFSCQTVVTITSITPSGISCTLGANPNTGNAPLNTTLTATVSPAGTAVSAYDWVFGDNQTSQTKTNTTPHTYQNQGSYTAVVTITAQSGDVTSCQTIVTVTSVGPTGITCNLEATPDRGNSPLATTLRASVFPATTKVDTYAFDFGDGSQPITQRSSTAQRTYVGKKTYIATVTIHDSTGQVATCNTTIVVDEIIAAATCRIEVVDYMDLNKNLQQDVGIVGFVDPGMNGARVSVQPQGGQTQNKVTAPVPNLINRYGEAFFENLPCGTYTVAIDPTSRVSVGGTRQQYTLNQLQRLTPNANSTQVTLTGAQPEVRVGFGYTPRNIEAFLCDISKTVSDTTANDEGTPDDPKVTNSSPGETLTYKIDWDCSGFPTTPPLSQTIGFTLSDDFYDPLLTIVPGSITGGGVYNQSQGIITWSVVGSTNVDKGSVTFQATIASKLAPGTYVLPNYVVAMNNNGEIIDQDQTITNVVVPEGAQVPDIEVIKYARDVNGGQVLPGDVLEYYVVTWNNGNTPLNNVNVTENIQPNVNGFKVISIPTGATDSSTATGGSNGTGYLNVSGFNLTNRGDTATITYQVTVNAGVPNGTELVNFVTAAADGDQDTDDETVVVGQVLPTPPPAPAPGPGPTPGVTGQTAVPPLLGPRAYVPPVTSAAPGPAPETGVGAVLWILMISLIAAFATTGYLLIRQRGRALES